MTRTTRAGTRWRILAYDLDGNPVVDLHSADYPTHISVKMVGGKRKRYKLHTKGVKRLSKRTVFDELCVDRWLHLEQMDRREWFLSIGEDKVAIFIDAKGNARMSEWYR